jgi:hypothetical protein
MAKQSQTKSQRRKTPRQKKRRWSGDVKTESTYAREGLFKEDAETIARELSSKRVSPRGIGSGIRMLQFYINRAGRNLSKTRRAELEKAKRKMQRRREEEE